MIELVLKPASTPGRYVAEMNGVPVVSSKQPFYDAARELLGRGVVPETELRARWHGSEIVAMRSTVGEAARWMVEETDKGGLSRRKWRPHWMAPGVPVGAPENALEASGRENRVPEAESASLSAPAHASDDPGNEPDPLSRPVDKVA